MICPLSGCALNKKYFLAVGLAFAFIFAYEWLVHGMLLAPIYESTAEVWRAKEDCIIWPMILGYFLIPAVSTLIYCKGHEGKGIGEGVRFGLLIGILFVPHSLFMYSHLPIPMTVMLAWVIAGIVEMVGMGVIIAKVYK